MTRVFIVGLLTGALMMAGLPLLLIGESRSRRARDYDRIVDLLADQLRSIDTPVFRLPSYRLDKLGEELSVLVCDRVNAKLPCFLPSTTRALINDYLRVSVKRDAAALVGRLVETLESEALTRRLPYRAVAATVVDELFHDSGLHRRPAKESVGPSELL